MFLILEKNFSGEGFARILVAPPAGEAEEAGPRAARIVVRCYLALLSAAVLFQVTLHPLFFCDAEHTCHLEFLPLMLLSVVSAVGLVTCWLILLYVAS